VIKKSSSIYQLDPAVKNGLLRVGGRLRRAQISEEAKHPSILPKTHHVITLIVNYYHHVLGHSGVEHTLSLIRERYWIVNGRSTVKNIIGKCYSCRKRQSPVSQQKTSLDTESFINALRHFIARRGQPEEICSDNGGNFVKGEKELKQAVNDWNQTHIHEALPQQNVKWTFNPPAGSHHGGVWERCIRTVRKVVLATQKEQQLDDESLNTLMCEVVSFLLLNPQLYRAISCMHL
jgi:hypothetical protein